MGPKLQRILAWAALPCLMVGAAVGFGISGAATTTTIPPGTYQLTPGTYTWICQSGLTNGANPGYYGVANTSTCAQPNTTTTTTTPPTTTTTTQPNTGLSLGSYNGNSNISGANAFDQETGTTSTNYDDYLDGSSFNSMCSGNDTPLPNIKGQLGNRRLIISVPLAGASYGVNGAQTLANYAANPSAWNSCFTTLANELVNDGFSNAIIRLMWEPDSGIYSSGDTTSAQNFATLWRDAWNSAQVSGQHFAWAWYFGANFDDNTNNTAYPGNQYVDYITFDQYDQSWTGACGLAYDGSNWNATQSQCVWNNDISNSLGRVSSFAASHGKPMGIGEWGVINRSDGHGGGDDPTYINNMTSWLKAHAQWESYFNFNSGGDSILSDYPNSLNAFKADL